MSDAKLTPADRLVVSNRAWAAQMDLDKAVRSLLDILPLLPPASVLAHEIEASIDDCVRARRNIDRLAATKEKP